MSTRVSSSEKEAIDPKALHALYLEDETAWLEIMSRLAAERRHDELDYENLSEFLESMANRDRRRVFNRLVTLLTHQLKWQCQESRRSRSWQLTIAEQRLRLRKELESGTLRNHARAILAEAYREAVKLAMIETGLDRMAFPAGPPATIEDVLRED